MSMERLSMVNKTQRLTFIDVARTYAIWMALFSHALITTGAYTLMGQSSMYLQTFTRMATPMFVVMFGFMIEFVYVTKVQNNGFDSIRKRLYVRSFQCYIGYLLISLSAMIGGYITIPELAGSTILIRDSRFGNILRIYAILLLIMPLIIKMRIKFGPRFLLISLIFLLLSYRLIEETNGISFGIISKPIHLLFGMGSLKGGPNLWHSLSFVFAGMYLASSLKPNNINSKILYYRNALSILVICFLIGAFIVGESSLIAWEKFTNSTYRVNNLSGYYLIGINASISAIVIIGLIIGSKKLPEPVNKFMELGKSSLFSFTIGNCILNLTGPIVKYSSPIVYISAFMAITTIITIVHTKLPLYSNFSRVLNFKPRQKLSWSKR